MDGRVLLRLIQLVTLRQCFGQKAQVHIQLHPLLDGTINSKIKGFEVLIELLLGYRGSLKLFTGEVCKRLIESLFQFTGLVFKRELFLVSSQS